MMTNDELLRVIFPILIFFAAIGFGFAILLIAVAMGAGEEKRPVEQPEQTKIDLTTIAVILQGATCNNREGRFVFDGENLPASPEEFAVMLRPEWDKLTRMMSNHDDIEEVNP